VRSWPECGRAEWISDSREDGQRNGSACLPRTHTHTAVRSVSAVHAHAFHTPRARASQPSTLLVFLAMQHSTWCRTTVPLRTGS
jgi:hypothetical protein